MRRFVLHDEWLSAIQFVHSDLALTEITHIFIEVIQGLFHEVARLQYEDLVLHMHFVVAVTQR